MISGEALGELTDALTTEHQAAQLAAQGARRERTNGRGRAARAHHAVQIAAIESAEVDTRIPTAMHLAST